MAALAAPVVVLRYWVRRSPMAAKFSTDEAQWEQDASRATFDRGTLDSFCVDVLSGRHDSTPALANKEGNEPQVWSLDAAGKPDKQLADFLPDDVVAWTPATFLPDVRDGMRNGRFVIVFTFPLSEGASSKRRRLDTETPAGAWSVVYSFMSG
jgi:hypothetical protein